MMTWSINLCVLAIGFLIAGLYKPQLLLFWMDKPKRMPIVLFSGFLFMVGSTMFGEANREKQKWLKEQSQQATETQSDTVPTVLPKMLGVKTETEKVVE
ncbi:MAG: hypothetical protein HFP81_02735 [Methylococcales symbiont of Hymedesmia sp. n. MRB-2018]|nr:MAG: hypothetical protein HFP78_09455 [Methylococcales symbiont of Hymedesmia sp. n. MRB-2018]KAF3984328.1 MAG: hypothetical protein HFP81_02735 [Methylococcales symbiont of Hymedesmia sp. n. MRB-2018]